jgi:hypothetical protein
VSQRIWALYGQAGHKLLEKEGANEFTEEYMEFDLDGIIVSGRIDLYDMELGKISDYKFVKTYKVTKGLFDDWNKQGLIYAWLLRKNGFKAETCQFIAFLKDHSQLLATYKPSYPKFPLYVHNFGVTALSLVEIEAFLRGKIAEYKRLKDLPDDEIPPCTPEERWDKPTKYAVTKNGSKRAHRVFLTQGEADEELARVGENYFIEFRPGESTKCMGYCACKKFCNFYQTNVKPAEEALAAKEAAKEETAKEDAE